MLPGFDVVYFNCYGYGTLEVEFMYLLGETEILTEKQKQKITTTIKLREKKKQRSTSNQQSKSR